MLSSQNRARNADTSKGCCVPLAFSWRSLGVMPAMTSGALAGFYLLSFSSKRRLVARLISHTDER
jgi:hypothetical protein